MRLTIRILSLVAMYGSSFPAQAQSLNFSDIRLIDRSAIEIRESRSPLAFAREPERVLSPETAPLSSDASLGRPIARLALDADAFLSLRVPLGGTQPRDATLVDFTVAGNLIRMLAIEARLDGDFDASHLTLVAMTPEDHARLTISRSGPEIAATIFVDDQWYRILPDESDNEYQLVYPVAVQENAWQRETQPDLESRAGQLEARHLQAAWVAETQPNNFMTYADGRPRMYSGPSLGVLDYWDALQFDPAGIGLVDEPVLTEAAARFLTEARGFTWVYERIDVQLEPITLKDVNTVAAEGLDLELFQLIDDIPISRSLQLTIDSTGDVTGFSGTLMRPEMGGPYNGPRILQNEARATAETALFTEHGIESTGELPAETLFYNVIEDDAMQLIWRMSVQANCGMVFDVDIDAITGQAIRIGSSTRSQGGNAIDTRPRNQFFDDVFMRCRYSPRR